MLLMSDQLIMAGQQDLLPSLSRVLYEAQDGFKTLFLCNSIAVNHNFLHKANIFVPFWTLLFPLPKQLETRQM